MIKGKSWTAASREEKSHIENDQNPERISRRKREGGRNKGWKGGERGKREGRRKMGRRYEGESCGGEGGSIRGCTM